MPTCDVVAPRQYVTSGLITLCHLHVIFMVSFSFSTKNQNFSKQIFIIEYLEYVINRL